MEYKDSLGQTRLALTEAPNEALPLDCRPNFGAAWLTKDKFKVDVAMLVVFSILWYILRTGMFLDSYPTRNQQ